MSGIREEMLGVWEAQEDIARGALGLGTLGGLLQVPASSMAGGCGLTKVALNVSGPLYDPEERAHPVTM